jgi:hypothetical protein
VSATLIAWQYTYSSGSAWFQLVFWGLLLLVFVGLPALVVVAVRRRRTAGGGPRPSRRRTIAIAGVAIVAVIASSTAGFGPIEIHSTAPVATGAPAVLHDRFVRDTGIWHVGLDGDTDIEYEHGRLALAVTAADLAVVTRRHIGEAAGLTVEVQVGGGSLGPGDEVGVLCGTEFTNPSHLEEFAITLQVGRHGPAAISYTSYLPTGPVSGNEVATRRIPSVPAKHALTLRVQCNPGKGAAVKLWINGKLAVTGGISPGFDSYNSVGLYAYSAKGNTKALFDNLVVSPT